MRGQVALVAAILLGATACSQSADGSVDPIGPGEQRYEISATYDAGASRLNGHETIRFTNTRTELLATVYLRLWPNGQTNCAKPFVVVADVQGGTAGPLDVGCTRLPIELDHPLAPQEQAEISFAFSDRVPRNWNFRYGMSGGVAMLGNAYPILALTDEEGDHGERYTLSGESMYSIVASWDVTLTIPPGMKAAATGSVVSSSRLADGRRRMVLHSEAERDFAMAIGRLRLSTSTADGIQLRYFAQRSSRVPAAQVLGWAGEAMEDFTQRYGPYDQPQIDLVGGTWQANGFEFPSLLMIAPTRDVVFHEIAHLWWYSMVGDNQWASPWVDESFTEFLTRRLKGTISSCDTEDPFRGVSGDLPLNSTMGTFDAEGHYVGTVYRGGPCALERLRRDWGDERFDGFMSGLVETYRGEIADTCDVIGAMRAAAPPGYDMDGYLEVARLESAAC